MMPIPAAWLLAALQWLRTADAATANNIVTAISPTSISRGATTSISITGGSAGQLGTFAQTGMCAFFTPSDDLGSGAISFNPPATATYDLCVRDAGEFDSVYQTGMQVVVVAATSNLVITGFTPTIVSNAVASTITLTTAQSLAGTKATFATAGNCNSANPSTDASSGVISFTPSTAGAHDLCFRASGGSDSILQSTAGTLTVQAGTSPNIVTALNPNGLTAGVPFVVTLSGTMTTGDRAQLALTGTCASLSIPLTNNPVPGTMTVTPPTAGTYDLCYTSSGGTDSVAQTSITVTVSAAPIVANDPVAVFNGKRVDFTLPPGKLVPLLRSPDGVILHGATFEGSGPWEQWFGRVVAEAPDSGRWIEVAIRHDLLSFNRSALARDAFESLEVTLGRGSIEQPDVVSRLPGLDVQVPVSFLGADVLFRKMHRHYNTAFTTIGRARRECMDFSGTELHFFVCAAPAGEYFGSPDRHLAIKFAHLNLAFVEAHNISMMEGLLPELWGLRPMSESAAAYVRDAAEKHGAPGQELEQEPTAKGQVLDFAKGLAWAGGPETEDLKKSCTEPNASFAETNATFTI